MVDQTGGGLMIVEVNQKIAGKISCIATNVLGSSKGSSEVKILGEHYFCFNPINLSLVF